MKRAAVFSLAVFSWSTFVFVVLLILLLSCSKASGMIESVAVDPPKPSTEDPVTVYVTGLFSDGCWAIGEARLTHEGNNFIVEVTGYDGWAPELACITVIVPYEITFDLGLLAPGHYRVKAFEYHQSLREPYPDSRELEFFVGCGDIGGDANCDGIINVGDAVFVINHVFKQGPAPGDLAAGDANCDGVINVGDSVFLINFVFKNGVKPGCP